MVEILLRHSGPILSIDIDLVANFSSEFIAFSAYQTDGLLTKK